MLDSVPSARYSSVCVNGESGSSLIIESTDSMIINPILSKPFIRKLQFSSSARPYNSLRFIYTIVANFPKVKSGTVKRRKFDHAPN